MSNLPRNYVRLEGEIDRSKLIELEGGSYLFKGSVKIPVESQDSEGNVKVHSTYISIVTFGDLALALSQIKKGTWVSIDGNIEVSRYLKRCSKCNFQSTNYWTDVRVSNFVEIDRPDIGRFLDEQE